MSQQSRPSSSWRPAPVQREGEATDVDDGDGGGGVGDDVAGDGVRGRHRDHSPGFRS